MEKYNTIKEFFLYINEHCNYLILRNWDDIFNDHIYGDSHEDIDILCEDLHSFVSLTNARRCHKRNDRDNFIISIGTMSVRFDIRHVGDGYYPKLWQEKMLLRRKKIGDIYIMSDEDYYYSLAYHALLQKPSLSNEYKNKLRDLTIADRRTNLFEEKDILKELNKYLKKNSYVIEITSDPGVFLNWKNIKEIGVKADPSRSMKRFFFSMSKKITSIYSRFRCMF